MLAPDLAAEMPKPCLSVPQLPLEVGLSRANHGP